MSMPYIDYREFAFVSSGTRSIADISLERIGAGVICGCQTDRTHGKHISKLHTKREK